MSPKEQITEAYQRLNDIISPSLIKRLRFIAPDSLKKNGGNIWRGRILSARPNSVFDSQWCYFEIGIGRYPVDVSNCGGVGLICFVNNKKCGAGQHSTAVSDIAARFATIHPQFSASRRGEKNQGLFSYYPGFTFPLQQAIAELKLLIETCVDSLESLNVHK